MFERDDSGNGDWIARRTCRAIVRLRPTALQLEDNLTKAIGSVTHRTRTLGKRPGISPRRGVGLSLSTLYRKIEKLNIEG